jgi:hypothetical protein
MTARRFWDKGQQWEVVSDGGGVGAGAGTGFAPRASRWLVTFRCISDPAGQEVKGQVIDRDLSVLPESELVRALNEALNAGENSDE